MKVTKLELDKGTCCWNGCESNMVYVITKIQEFHNYPRNLEYVCEKHLQEMKLILEKLKKEKEEVLPSIDIQ
jgi:hypothetical protein